MNMRTLALSLVAFLIALLPLAGCHMSNPGDDTKQAQTAILRVEVEPSPVPQGETATFTAVIEDSTDQSFRFDWIIDGEGALDSKSNKFRWTADVEPGTYDYAVTARNGNSEERPVTKSFEVTVVE